MNEKLSALYDLVSSDLDLQEELNDVVSGVEVVRDEAVTRRNMAVALVDFAHAHGLELSVEDFLVPAREGALSDEELAGVAGGAGSGDPIADFLLSFEKQVYTDGLAPTDFWRP